MIQFVKHYPTLMHVPAAPILPATATGVSNLGNTCYMNAALQALAHAPELCHALDAESHLRRCPIALRNQRRRRKREKEAAATRGDAERRGECDRFAVASMEGDKFHRRSNSGSSSGSAGSKGKKQRKTKGDAVGSSAEYGPEYEFCTLCEVEKLLGRVHARPEETPDDPEDGFSASRAGAAPSPRQSGGPVVPETFVTGFMSKVAPWFRRGVQEDSHEFLRLLIDAMQNSCRDARRDRGAPTPPSETGDFYRGSGGNDDTEYPFQLFRGTVESNVTCSACRATSCKIDPIEDIGLDILPLRPGGAAAPSSNPYASSTRGCGASSMSSSRSTNPTAHLPLADVQQALERFISSEHLDSGYKCEQCGKLGKATKTSKLASIPPILTLHLKRFRYGTGGSKRRGGCADSAGFSSTRSSGRATRGAAAHPSADFDHIGPSGSAKIEGHVRFSTVLDIKPYLTPELQQGVFQKAICRLFAVVVHTGKNSHSGHYVAYVQNVSKKEWWKMDDAKIVRVPWNEVQSAEAYMLFYRVTSHPVAHRLKEVATGKEEQARQVAEELRRREAAEEARREADAQARNAVSLLQDLTEAPVASAGAPGNVEDPVVTVSPVMLGKRARPRHVPPSGLDWARAATTLAPEYLPLFVRIQDFIAEHVTFSPEFFKYITEEYNRMSATMSIGRRVKSKKRIRILLGKGPAGVYPPEDVQGGANDIRGGILDLFHQISIMCKKANHKGSCGEPLSDSLFVLPKVGEEAGTGAVEKKDLAASASNMVTSTAVLPPEDMSTLSMDNELFIPTDNSESYDGAL